jgi:hypothetical protein
MQYNRIAVISFHEEEYHYIREIFLSVKLILI